jgi:hypothetical protein
VGLKLNGTHQLPAYADDVNGLRDNVGTITESIEPLFDVSKEVGTEVNAEKASICFCLVTRMQVKIGTEIANRSLENKSQFTYLVTTLTNKTSIR